MIFSPWLITIDYEWSSQKYCLGYLKFPISNFQGFVSGKFHVHPCNIEGKQKPQLSWKGATVRWDKVKFGHQGQAYNVYVWPLSIQGESEVIRCISDFRQPCISKWLVVCRMAWMKIWISGVSVNWRQGTFDSFSRSVWGYSVHFRFSATLYVENGWP